MNSFPPHSDLQCGSHPSLSCSVEAHHFLTVWKHAQVISIFKPGKDPPLPSSYHPISLLDMIGKLFEKILLARILHVVSKHGLMQDEQFRFRPKCSMSLQLACLVERIARNFGKKKLTSAVCRPHQSPDQEL